MYAAKDQNPETDLVKKSRYLDKNKNNRNKKVTFLSVRARRLLSSFFDGIESRRSRAQRKARL